MNKLLRSFLLIPTIFVLSTVASEAAESSLTVPDREWVQVSVPFANLTVGEVFGQISPDDTMWSLYAFDNLAGRYAKRNRDDRIQSGRGYWFIQTTGSTMTITIEGEAPQSGTSIIAHSAGDSHPFVMLGNPYPNPIQESHISFEIDGQKFSFGEVTEESIYHNRLYSWNGSTYDVYTPGSDNALGPWRGFWGRSLVDRKISVSFSGKEPAIKSFEKLLSNGQLTQMFEDLTPYPARSGFGVGPMAYRDNDCVVFGLGQIPAGYNGAAITEYCPSQGIVKMDEIPEQGISALMVLEDVVYVPGTDATSDRSGPDDCGSNGHLNGQWAWGVTYKRLSNGQIVTSCKSQAVHDWDILEVDGVLYTAASGHIPDGPTFQDSTLTSLLFASAEFAEPGSWVEIGNRYSGLGDYRAYRITWVANTLIVQANDALSEHCYLVKDVGGYQFERIVGPDVHCFYEMYEVDNKVVAIPADLKGLLIFDPTDNSVERVLTESVDGQFWIGRYDYLAQDDKHIYIGTSDGRVMQAEISHLAGSQMTWKTYAQMSHPRKPIGSIAISPTGVITIATGYDGTDAMLWKTIDD